MSKKTSQVTIISVNSNKEKVNAIINCSIQCLKENKRLIFFVENDQAEKFLDHLLWSGLKESFIPHSIIDKPCIDPIAITKSDMHLSSYDSVFNLTSHVIIKDDHSLNIYELRDTSNPEKEKASNKRIHDYKESGYSIEPSTM